MNDRTERSATSSPSNARLPVSISNSTTPNAQMSARLSDSSAARLLGRHVGGGAENHAACASSRARDGRRHATRSATTGVEVSIALARPKSSTFTRAVRRRSFDVRGLEVAMDDPCSWAASSASAICLAIGSASSSGIGARGNALRQILALDELHAQSAACLLEPVRSRRCSDG